MTPLNRAMSFFPLAHVAFIFASVMGFFYEPTVRSFLSILFVIYLLPVLAFRIMGHFFPIREGASRLTADRYSAWRGGQHMQLLFDAVPAFEAVLRLIPGAYSTWLRLWGSDVGHRVYWTPTVRISDRSMMRIGDDVVFGHDVQCFAHFVTQRRRGTLLLVRRIQIGSGSFLGAFVRLGPGVRVGKRVELGTWVRAGYGVTVEDSARVAPDSDLWPRTTVRAGTSSAPSASGTAASP